MKLRLPHNHLYNWLVPQDRYNVQMHPEVLKAPSAMDHRSREEGHPDSFQDNTAIPPHLY